MINTWTDAVEIIGHFTDSYDALKEYAAIMGRSQEGNYIVVAKRKGATKPVVLKVSEHEKLEADRQIELVTALQKLNDGEHASGDADYLLPVQAFFGPDRMSENSGRFYTVVEFPFGRCDLNKLIRESHKEDSKDLGDIVNAYNANREQFAMDTAEQVAKALNCAYNTEGVIHRDIKTSNILIDKLTGKEGVKRGVKTWLGDFQTMYWADRNTALAVSQSRSLTTPGQLHGTYKYIPQEEIKASDGIQFGRIKPGSKNISNRTPSRDIYSLGLVMYQILTGTPEDDLIALGHSQEDFMSAKEDQEGFYKYLGLDKRSVIGNFVLREIIKKCLRYDKSKQERWEEKAKEGKEIDEKETPWHERYQTHQELVDDLGFAREFSGRFNELEALLSKSADEDAEELAKGLKRGNSDAQKAEDKPGEIAQKVSDLRAALRGKGYLTEEGRRHWIHEAFEANVLRRKAEEHAAEIAKCYVQYMDDLEKGTDSTKHYLLREEASIKLRQFDEILKGYAAVLGNRMPASVAVKKAKAESSEGQEMEESLFENMGLEFFLLSLENLAAKYSPGDSLKKLKDTEPKNEIEAKQLIADLGSCADSISYNGNDNDTIERIRKLKEDITKKKQAVEETLSTVRKKCEAVIENYLEFVTADAVNWTVQTGLDAAMAELDKISHDGFFEVRCARAELTGIDYVLGGFYTGRWDSAKKEEFERLYKLSENGDMRHIATMNVQTLVELAKEGEPFFTAAKDLLESLKKSEESLEEVDEKDSMGRKYNEDFAISRRYFEFVNSHVENIATTFLNTVKYLYSITCKKDHGAATKSTTTDLGAMPIANHPVVKARREIYEKREEYRKALSSTVDARTKIAGELISLASRLRELGAISEFESNTYNTLSVEHVLEEKSKRQEKDDEEIVLMVDDVDPKSQLEALTKGHNGKYEDVLKEDDLLADIAVVMCLEGAGRHDDAFAACDAVSAPDKFANEPWFVYRLAENAVNFRPDDNRFETARAKLSGLEQKVHGEERNAYFSRRGDFYFKTARTPGDLQQAARDFEKSGNTEKRDKAQDCISTVEGINSLLKVDKLTPLPETARYTLASNWNMVKGNIGHLKEALGEDHPFVEQALLDLCRWISDYECLVKEETRQDNTFIITAEAQLRSLKSREPRTESEHLALQAKIASLERALGAFKADRMRFRRDIVPFLRKACDLFGGRENFEVWLNKR